MAAQTRPARYKVRLVRSVLLKGEHTEKGTVAEMPAGLAASLVCDGSAEWDEGSASEAVPPNEPLVMSPSDEIRIISTPQPRQQAAPVGARTAQGTPAPAKGK